VGNGAGARAGDWYAIRVRSNRERKVSAALTARGIPTYCPTYTEQAQWSDRVKSVERFLFPGYLFIAAAPNAGACLTVPGVIQILPNNMKPTAIANDEIESIRKASSQPCTRPSAYTVGETVQVKAGPMAGQSGVIERTKAGGVRLIVNLELLNRAVSVEVSAADVATVTGC
jgi:transcription antitermination factor NusG